MDRSSTQVDDLQSDGGPTIEDVFDVDSAMPYEAEQTIHRYLSQETRHNVLQAVLGHPEHLVSTTEFDYYISRSRSTISEQLSCLADHSILRQYHHEQNEGVRDLPSDFWGFTAFGIRIVDEFRLLRGLPVMRAVHDATEKSATVRRHEDAPRPDLPDDVNDALSFNEATELDPITVADEIPYNDDNEPTFYSESTSANEGSLNDGADGDRTLDELF